jgi:molybdate transport system substrate-binding protein
VAAAADLKFALDEVVDLFRVRHPNIRLQVTYGSSGISMPNFPTMLPSMSSSPLTLTTRSALFARVLHPTATNSSTVWAAS